MDPISIIGLTATIGKLLQLGGEIPIGIRNLSSKYRDCASTLSMIEVECATIQAAVTQIKEWIEADLVSSPSKEALADPLQTALKGCCNSMEALQTELLRFQSREGESSTRIRWNKIKHTLDDKQMRSYLDDLRWQANGMHFLVATTKL